MSGKYTVLLKAHQWIVVMSIPVSRLEWSIEGILLLIILASYTRRPLCAAWSYLCSFVTTVRTNGDRLLSSPFISSQLGFLVSLHTLFFYLSLPQCLQVRYTYRQLIRSEERCMHPDVVSQISENVGRPNRLKLHIVDCCFFLQSRTIHWDRVHRPMTGLWHAAQNSPIKSQNHAWPPKVVFENLVSTAALTSAWKTLAAFLLNRSVDKDLAPSARLPSPSGVKFMLNTLFKCNWWNARS